MATAHHKKRIYVVFLTLAAIVVSAPVVRKMAATSQLSAE